MASSIKGWRLGFLAVVVAAALAGWGAGFALRGPEQPQPEQALLWDDYIVGVAALYAREESLSQAQERLRALNSPDVGHTVAMLALAYTPVDPQGQEDAQALRELAAALKPGFMLGASSGAQPTATTSAPPAPRPPPRWESLFHRRPPAPAAIFFAGLFLVGVGGVLGLAPQRRPEALAALKAQPSFPNTSLPQGQPEKVRAAHHRQPSRGSRGPKPLPQPTGRQAPKGARGAAVGQLVIESHYQLGDDNFQEVLPIADPKTGRLVGGCGVSCGPKFAGRGVAAYYGFGLWVQDEESGEPSQLVGLVSPWAEKRRKRQVTEWAQRESLAAVLPVGLGPLRRFDTQNLVVEASVPDFAYGSDSAYPPESYFLRLMVRFGVTIRPR